MIQRLLLICIIALSFSCETEKTSFTINGNVKGLADGTEVKLQELINNKPSIIDSATVKNEAFTFTGVADTAEMHFIALKDVNGNLPFILENGDINITVNTENLNKSVLEGTLENKLLYTYTSSLMAAGEKNQALGQKYQQAQQNQDNETMEAIIASFDSLKEAQSAFEIKFAKDNSNTLVSVLVLERLLFSKGQDPIKLKEVYDALPEHLKNSMSGKNIAKNLDPILARAEAEKAAAKMTPIGGEAPGFEAPNPKGNMIALKDVTSKNKVTIVDFWAAWCGPCRKENPNLVRLYDKYQDKGLEIIGVSLDGDRRQKDPKAAWIKAIADDGLTWKQVSNLKYFGDPIAEAYGIRAIPATFVLDNEGKIIAKELRGQALENKIAELLN